MTNTEKREADAARINRRALKDICLENDGCGKRVKYVSGNMRVCAYLSDGRTFQTVYQSAGQLKDRHP
jgi:hypothetical protein